ncbi:MAG: transglutaminase-like domain-containing protein [Butyrivibrio sp.]|uniref:transglutaminase-like domain-containing protein n=1 Tax=Butyrivibrio sp. TaxID=28121 RepID=UPI0025FE503F|nr:transglutaminase-like domain-containing protein [Butyrivibrio sp.]MCR5772084.1 transglutaminase-like domain-containing protein [Butyrivibrio sp.]
MIFLHGRKKIHTPIIFALSFMLILGCSEAGSVTGDTTRSLINNEDNIKASSESTFDLEALNAVKGSRDNTPVVLVPEKSGEEVYENDIAQIDTSNSGKGYIYAKYTGTNNKVKLQITGPDQVIYTYNLSTGGLDEVFPLSAGDGSYLINIYENISGNQYSLGLTATIEASLEDEFYPYLYPNQYVWFTKDMKAIAMGSDLAFSANSDLDVITNVYNFMISTISYDYEEAETVQSGYIPDIDEVLTTQKGICLDYACLMSAMLRSQNIPTHMEIGYAGTEYHAWISCYIDEKGWVNGIVQFDGTSWQLIDPTFGSTTAEDVLRSYIAEDDSYIVKYIY